MASVELFYIIAEDKFKTLQQCKTEKERIENDTVENSGDSTDVHHNDSGSDPADMASRTTSDDMSNDDSDADEDDSEPSQTEGPGSPMQAVDILKRISGRVRPRARIILHLINSSLKWNKKGEIITQSGDVIHGSDISIIVRNIALPYKNRHVIGSHYVDNVMRRMNIPIQSMYKKVLTSNNVKQVKSTNVKPQKTIDQPTAKKPIKWLKF